MQHHHHHHFYRSLFMRKRKNLSLNFCVWHHPLYTSKSKQWKKWLVMIGTKQITFSLYYACLSLPKWFPSILRHTQIFPPGLCPFIPQFSAFTVSFKGPNIQDGSLHKNLFDSKAGITNNVAFLAFFPLLSYLWLHGNENEIKWWFHHVDYELDTMK